MSSVKEHYDSHLGNFYSWMTGNLETRVEEEFRFLEDHNIRPKGSGWALDLGAGHGIHTLALAKAGFRVKAIDFNAQLLSELKQNVAAYPVEIIEDDIRNLRQYAEPKPELIVCGGDTLAHLESWKDIHYFIEACRDALDREGQLILSFRDYSVELKGPDRIIPVKSDENRILTCILDYREDKVLVTDLLHEKTEAGWQQSASTYQKMRTNPRNVNDILKTQGMEILHQSTVLGMMKLLVRRSQ